MSSADKNAFSSVAKRVFYCQEYFLLSRVSSVIKSVFSSAAKSVFSFVDKSFFSFVVKSVFS